MTPILYLDIDGVVLGYDGRESYLKVDFNDPDFFNKPSILMYDKIYDFILHKVYEGYNIQILSYVPAETFNDHCKNKTRRFDDWMHAHDLWIPSHRINQPTYIVYGSENKIHKAMGLEEITINPGDILIDDEMKNLVTFEHYGGKSYHPDCFR